MKPKKTKKKKQKVRFHKGDKRPGGDLKEKDLYYTKKMVKRGKKIVWQCIEHPKKKIVKECFFEEDAADFVKFQNKHKVWLVNGGIPDFLCIKGERNA
tara:strand:+ start:178 stop:471 length:294 start_codon:yes stop_codon:yes gene_type:complete